ncbi:menaquinone-dependent protoporphyrinogen oxidase [Lachnotalea glycerini]|uniref:Flavodoxin n=1 Tax=Lachnotalea glycerini TaxID=1763509 RepID=A0A255IM67_9FIRM|nr:flavodoxin domain-containing protein [Lachnotalea glycerini]PXV95619.1 menaquinone-dependent protoporphyrinogen oxidase [Lachnotalea glycerini]RDY32909.1 flavodoxin [Lachnotalea glycerini]
MQTLILYATKSGATEECANILAKKLDNCPIYNLKQSTPDISGYDTIIIGAGVHMGKIYKPVFNYIRQNLNLLLTKTVKIYLCNAYPDTFQKTIDKNIPVELISHSSCIKSFGGKPAFTNPPQETWLNKKNLEDFIETLNK